MVSTSGVVGLSPLGFIRKSIKWAYQSIETVHLQSNASWYERKVWTRASVRSLHMNRAGAAEFQVIRKCPIKNLTG